jgi:hypothetical protein
LAICNSGGGLAAGGDPKVGRPGGQGGGGCGGAVGTNERNKVQPTGGRSSEEEGVSGYAAVAFSRG